MPNYFVPAPATTPATAVIVCKQVIVCTSNAHPTNTRVVCDEGKTWIFPGYARLEKGMRVLINDHKAGVVLKYTPFLGW